MNIVSHGEVFWCLKIQPVKLSAALVLVKLHCGGRYFYKADGVQHRAPEVVFYGDLAEVYIKAEVVLLLGNNVWMIQITAVRAYETIYAITS
jgi:hypothetical protein